MPVSLQVEQLKARLAGLSVEGRRDGSARFQLGMQAADEHLDPGLCAFSLHDIHAETGADAAAANAFALGLAMRAAHLACEAAIAEMEAFTRENVPKGNVSEDDIWAELHKGNIRRGGEWIETRLLASGPRTNPWFQECGPRIVQENEIVAFDTDLIGAYGFCIDISRTWWVGDQRPTNAMIIGFWFGERKHVAAEEGAK